MKRETRTLKCDFDPQAATRRDLVPAPVRFAEESSPASSIEPMRELQPYTALRPNADDQTVKYALMQGGSAPGHEAGERPSDVPAELRSGTRVTPTATLPPAPMPGTHSTTPPASHVQAKVPPAPANARIPTPLPANARIPTPLPANARIATPLPSNARIRTPLPANARIATPLPANARIATPLPRDARYASSSISFAPPPRPVPESSLPPPRAAAATRGPSLLLTLLVAGMTIAAAAFVGASLGDGSLQRWWARSFADAPKSAPAVTASPARSVPASPAATVRPRDVTPAEPPASSAVDSSAPAVRFQDLPPSEPTSEAEAPEPPVAPVLKRPRMPHRH